MGYFLEVRIGSGGEKIVDPIRSVPGFWQMDLNPIRSTEKWIAVQIADRGSRSTPSLCTVPYVVLQFSSTLFTYLHLLV